MTGGTIKLPPSDPIPHVEKGRVVGYAPYAPRKKAEGWIDETLIVLKEYAAQLPVTLRQILYRLVAKSLIEKNASDSLNDVLSRARRAGMIPWEAIRDDGIISSRPGGFVDEDHARRELVRILSFNGIHADLGQPIHQIVICEAAGMVPQLKTVADPFGVTIFSGGGFDSTTGKKELAAHISNDGRPCIVWHIGDLDPSGTHLFGNICRDVRAFCGWPDSELAFKRLAVNPAQVEDYQLTTQLLTKKPALSYPHEYTCQAEALEPSVMAAILREALETYFDRAVYDAEQAKAPDMIARITADLLPESAE